MPLWHPDTCDCKFDVAEDWKSAKLLSACKYHANVSDPFSHVRNENAFKNMVVGHIQERYPDYDGSYTISNGPLTVYVANLALDQKTALQTDLDVTFSINGVKVI